MDVFLKHYYESSYFIAATVICLATFIYHAIEIPNKKAQNWVFSLLLIFTVISSATSIAVVFTREYAAMDITARLIMETSQYIYFVIHTLLPVMFYLYVAMVSGVIYAHSRLRQFITMIPCILIEIMALINPMVHFVYYYDQNQQMNRGWGEAVLYAVSGLYIALAIVHLLRYWKMLTFRRRWALLYSFGIAILGVVLQMVNIKLRVELMFEAMAFSGILFTVEKEDDRTDTATGVCNRSALAADVANLLRLKIKASMICIRITNADMLQRVTGSGDSDAVLKDVADYLAGIYDKYNIYRSQSSFLLLCKDYDAEKVRNLAYEITRRFDAPWTGNGADMRLKAVLLIAAMPEEYRSVEDVMLMLDCAIPVSEGRRILTGEELKFIKRDAQIEEALVKGFAEHNFEIYYQPVYNLKSKSIHSAEAQFRLLDSKLEVLYPEDFLPIAAKSDIMERLNTLIFEEICLFLSSGIPTEMGLQRINVGISAHQCLNPSFLEDLKKYIRKYGVDASFINFELREFATAGDYPLLKQVIGTMREMGFKLSLDRFGMGDSNLQSLTEMHFDVVNMDVELMLDSDGGRDDDLGYRIVENSVRMISQMHRQILIRGIRTQAQVDRLSELDVDYLQGDYYSKPVTQNELISILRVTEVARREEQQARAKSEAKSSFLANMSHEIRTPINAILGMNEMILRECGDGNIISYARDIERAGNTLLSLINDILDFSKIEAGNMEIVPVEYGLSSVINDVANMIQVKIAQKNLEFRLDIDETLPEDLFGDEMRIRQIIVNILNNAVKYTNEGYVKLSVHGRYLDEDTIQLLVDITDTGIGIKEEDMGNLFGTFQRLDIDKNRTVEGTGLGLAITQNLLKLMSGDIDVKSVYGQGSTFSIRFPQMVLDRKPIGNLKERYRITTESRVEYRESFTAPDARILVVDDTPMNLTVVKGLLKKTKLIIDTAISGMECLEMTAVTKYDCIFLDYRMPEMDGTTTFKRLRDARENKNRETPVIVLTANALSGAREKFLAEGFDDYLTKPIETRKLEQTLIKYLPQDKVIFTGSGEGGAANEEAPSGEPENGVISLLRENAPEIDIKEGLVRCGGIDGYLDALKIYVSSLASKIKEVRQFFEEEDWENYTIRVHSLKSTSRVIGALDLGEEAWVLEQAGDAGDTETIESKTPVLLDHLEDIDARLKKVFSADDGAKEKEGSDEPPIDDVTLKEGYQALADFVASMDFDDSSFVLDEMAGYVLPKTDAARIQSLREALEILDWDKMTGIINEALGDQGDGK
ncbi:MAG: EAL domain-containing protein [Lachnospiraceae bacterium]|nr:EAL domain-containing protein [Lachnospiraceae bacterium]